jgi:hypothetical protein
MVTNVHAGARGVSALLRRCQMGWGDFGSNGSVHWRIHQHDNPSGPPDASGVDTGKRHPGQPGPRPIVGRDKGGKEEHDAKFRITARYPDQLAAKAGLAQARVVGNTVILEVEVWDPPKDSTNTFDPPEVTVDW